MTVKQADDLAIRARALVAAIGPCADPPPGVLCGDPECIYCLAGADEIAALTDLLDEIGEKP